MGARAPERPALASPRGQACEQGRGPQDTGRGAKTEVRPPPLPSIPLGALPGRQNFTGPTGAAMLGSKVTRKAPPLRPSAARQPEPGGVAREESRLGVSRGVTATPPHGTAPLCHVTGGSPHPRERSGPAPRPT